jgi:hypothetical protein
VIWGGWVSEIFLNSVCTIAVKSWWLPSPCSQRHCCVNVMLLVWGGVGVRRLWGGGEMECCDVTWCSMTSPIEFWNLKIQIWIQILFHSENRTQLFFEFLDCFRFLFLECELIFNYFRIFKKWFPN